MRLNCSASSSIHWKYICIACYQTVDCRRCRNWRACDANMLCFFSVSRKWSRMTAVLHHSLTSHPSPVQLSLYTFSAVCFLSIETNLSKNLYTDFKAASFLVFVDEKVCPVTYRWNCVRMKQPGSVPGWALAAASRGSLSWGRGLSGLTGAAWMVWVLSTVSKLSTASCLFFWGIEGCGHWLTCGD